MAIWVGIDVSKDTLDCGWCSRTHLRHIKVSNDKQGFRKFLRETPKHANFIMEATGAYHINCALFLRAKKRHVSVENPIRIKRHMQANLQRAKTDKSDSFAIARFGEEKQPQPWNGILPRIAEMQQLQALADKLQIQIQQFRNQRHAFTRSVLASKFVLQKIQNYNAYLENERKLIQFKLEEVAQLQFKRELALITTIPSIGLSSAIRLAIAVRDFSRFKTSKQLVSFLGLSPTPKQSGTSLNSRGSISHMGGAKVRAALYFCAMCAPKCNKPCKALFKRMKAKHKPGKVIIIAIIHKLVRQVHAVVKNRVPYDANYARKHLVTIVHR